MYPELKERVVLITGAAKGIGRGIAEKLASEGTQLIQIIVQMKPLLKKRQD